MPAAVNWPVKKLPNSFEASTTARYPAMFAVELSASIFWARVIRGIMSTASVVTPRPRSASRSSSFWAGKTKEIRVPPSRSRWISSTPSPERGARTFSTTSAAKASSPPTTRAPAVS